MARSLLAKQMSKEQQPSKKITLKNLSKHDFSETGGNAKIEQQ